MGVCQNDLLFRTGQQLDWLVQMVQPVLQVHRLEQLELLVQVHLVQDQLKELGLQVVQPGHLLELGQLQVALVQVAQGYQLDFHQARLVLVLVV